MNILDIKSENSLQNATEVLTSGGVLVFPTDTVYGVGCVLNKSAIRKLYKIKNRPSTQPTAVLMNQKIFKENIKKDLFLPNKIETQFYSGLLTLVIPATDLKIEFPKTVIAEDQTIAVRLPNHLWLSQLIDQVGPIVTSSANKKGETPPKNFADISTQIIKEADLTIKSEEKSGHKPSAIYHLLTRKFIRS
jgi:L-threonylcarbamoyladenylate synthase